MGSRSIELPQFRERICGGRKSLEPEIVKVVQPSDKRTLIVPRTEPKLYPVVFKKEEYDRLKERSKVITQQEHLQMIQEASERKNELMRQCIARKGEFQKWDEEREKAKGMKKQDVEGAIRADHLLERALELHYSQDDAVKKAKSLVLATKCHAIRNAQIAEKQLIQKEMQDEDRRLDCMVEQERLRAIQRDEKKKEEYNEQKRIFTQHVVEQIREKERQKFVEAELKEEESRLINKAALETRVEEVEEHKRKWIQREQLKHDLMEINRQQNYIQQLQEEENYLADLKIQEFMRRKAEQEKAREDEQKAMRLAKEQESARLQALQEKQQDIMGTMNALNAQRVQDEAEREWRRKEQAAARKKAQEIEALKAAREAQILDHQRTQALEIAREKREFTHVLKVQRDEAEKEKIKQQIKQNEMRKLREDIVKQINEKELERIKQRQELFHDGLAMKLEQEQHDYFVKKLQRKEVEDLRNNKMPEAYIKEMKRQLNMED